MLPVDELGREWVEAVRRGRSAKVRAWLGRKGIDGGVQAALWLETGGVGVARCERDGSGVLGEGFWQPASDPQTDRAAASRTSGACIILPVFCGVEAPAFTIEATLGLDPLGSTPWEWADVLDGAGDHLAHREAAAAAYLKRCREQGADGALLDLLYASAVQLLERGPVELCDLIALDPAAPDRWWRRTGLGEWLGQPPDMWPTGERKPALRPDPMTWVLGAAAAGGPGVVPLSRYGWTEAALAGSVRVATVDEGLVVKDRLQAARRPLPELYLLDGGA